MKKKIFTGKEFCELREKKGYSQKTLADYLEVSEATIWRLENGVTKKISKVMVDALKNAPNVNKGN